MKCDTWLNRIVTYWTFKVVSLKIILFKKSGSLLFLYGKKKPPNAIIPGIKTNKIYFYVLFLSQSACGTRFDATICQKWVKNTCHIFVTPDSDRANECKDGLDTFLPCCSDHFNKFLEFFCTKETFSSVPRADVGKSKQVVQINKKVVQKRSYQRTPQSEGDIKTENHQQGLVSPIKIKLLYYKDMVCLNDLTSPFWIVCVRSKYDLFSKMKFSSNTRVILRSSFGMIEFKGSIDFTVVENRVIHGKISELLVPQTENTIQNDLIFYAEGTKT
ncbi:hypothetical protein EGR_01931 [Echinococcus granulosus]|uniref:Uncharacterized protein n=1 Tax=Echinococcus granulosus TaxID=6210 RepID=W6UX70_ECHGR|nr:hypothetical protein EGR_01931 [Echinococcus granulosus]EUB63127.1 hypothetical protein EGR_01931 [Echinococcus granulosus]